MYSAKLECDHVVQWSSLCRLPKVGVDAWCVRCELYRAVVQRLGQWRVQCNHCRLRKSGLQPFCVMQADAHIRMQPAHVMSMWQDGNESEAFRIRRSDLALSLDDALDMQNAPF